MSFDYLFNCLILGNRKVGKTSVLLKYFENTFSESHNTFIGKEFFTKIIHDKDKNLKIVAWDPIYFDSKSMMRSYYRFKSVVILIFDLTDKQSFDQMDDWIKTIKNMMDDHPYVILIGNKADLVEQRSVSYESAKQYADNNSMRYFETSAKEDQKKFHCIFELITKEISIKIEKKESTQGIVRGTCMCNKTIINTLTGEFNILYRDTSTGKLVTIKPYSPTKNTKNQCC